MRKEVLGMEIHVTLKDCLRRLELIELGKPAHERRPVPNVTELADAAGVSRNAMSNLVNNNRQRIDLSILEGVVQELRRRGFEVDVADLFAIRQNGGRGKEEPASVELTGVLA
jgi:DNA-binding Xre family transcriptional regulator